MIFLSSETPGWFLPSWHRGHGGGFRFCSKAKLKGIFMRDEAVHLATLYVSVWCCVVSRDACGHKPWLFQDSPASLPTITLVPYRKKVMSTRDVYPFTCERCASPANCDRGVLPLNHLKDGCPLMEKNNKRSKKTPQEMAYQSTEHTAIFTLNPIVCHNFLHRVVGIWFTSPEWKEQRWSVVAPPFASRFLQWVECSYLGECLLFSFCVR